jgi:hypothetical protein
LAAFERKVLRGFLEGIKVHENWRQRYNKESMLLFGDLDILSFVRLSRLNFIGHVNRMDSKRIVSQVFNSNPRGIRVSGRLKTMWWNCVHIYICINEKLQISKVISKHRADWERSTKEPKVCIGL